MESMFSPIKKIFTYIQKNASGGNMFGNSIANNEAEREQDDRQPQEEAETGSNQDKSSSEEDRKDEAEKAEDGEESLAYEQDLEVDLEDDIEEQIKTTIIDATKVKERSGVSVPTVLSPNLQLDDELADFAEEPVLAVNNNGDTESDLDERFLDLDTFPSREIIVLNDTDLNSSLASDNVSEDPLAIDDFTQPLARDSDNVLDSSSVTTNEEVDTSGDLLWLKLVPDPEADQLPPSGSQKSGSLNSDAPLKHPKTKEDELRSDGGSDSGLGSETSALQLTINETSGSLGVTPTATPTQKPPSVAPSAKKQKEDVAVVATTSQAACPEPKKPPRSNLKRRLEDIDLGLSSSSSTQGEKRPKRSINFESVKVYYFPRQQGFSCVPTVGGCTLGMGARHIGFKTMTLAEHAAELRRAHRNQNQDMQARGSSSEDTEESEEDYLSEGSGSDADGDSNGFLQPVTPKQRRALLKAAGVRKIDASEKLDCRDIRNSREVCGCSCREFCDPETCACSQAGIKCQVDRAMFPCGCTREACGNTVGRVEFNPTRVRTHYIHTVMRLDLEQRQGQNPSSLNYAGAGGSPVGAVSVPNVASHCYFMPTQSNYSSGYASPAYTPDGSVLNYYHNHQPPAAATGAAPNQGEQPQTTTAAQGYQELHTPQYPQLDSLDSSLFASGSTATPSYGELLAPTYHSLNYSSAASANQLTSPYSAYHHQQPQQPQQQTPPLVYSSCAVPSAPPFGNATTTAATAHYQQAAILETTASASSITSTTTFLATAPAASTATVTACAFSSGQRTPGSVLAAEFINLNSPIASSSRLSQINDLLQHNRNTTAALVAVSESPGSCGFLSVSARSSSTNTTTTTTIDSIDTPPIEESGGVQRRNCLDFEELPPTPIVGVIQPTPTAAKSPLPTTMALQMPPTAPQPRQPLDGSGSAPGTATDSASLANPT